MLRGNSPRKCNNVEHGCTSGESIKIHEAKTVKNEKRDKSTITAGDFNNTVSN